MSTLLIVRCKFSAKVELRYKGWKGPLISSKVTTCNVFLEKYVNQDVQIALAMIAVRNDTDSLVGEITLQEIEARENASANDTIYCCIVNVAF